MTKKPARKAAKKPHRARRSPGLPADTADSFGRASTVDKYDNLLAEAAKLMATKGYDDTSMRDVAEATGFSLAGMYYYFDSKEDLLFKIQHNTFTQLVEEQTKASRVSGDPREAIERMVANYLSFFSRHRNELKVCAFEIESLKGDAYERVRDIRHRWYELLAHNVGGAMGATHGTPDELRLVRHHTLFIFGMLNWIFMWFDHKRDDTLQLGPELSAMIFEGLPTVTTPAAPKKRKVRRT